MASHKEPSLPLVMAMIPRFGGAMNKLGANSSKEIPSKRTRPLGVPSHRKPSGVCARLVTVLLGRPSSVCQGRVYHKLFVVTDWAGLATSKAIHTKSTPGDAL